MNPSDTETSSSSSSSAGPGEYATPTRQLHAGGDERTSGERARGASAPPAYLRETDSRSSCDDDVLLGSQRKTSQGAGGKSGDITTRMSTTVPARNRTDRSSLTGRIQRGDEEMAAGTSSRQRPLSAPPKAYPFSRDLELSREHDSPGEARHREATAVRAGRDDTEDPFPGEAGRVPGGGDGKERAIRGHVAETLPGSVESRTAQERLSLSSIFGAASERRVSEENRPSIRNSLLLDGNDGNANSGAAQPNLREKGKKENCGKAKSATVAALSSKDFGLHQWKEYAVLRHGNNRRFVNSQHGREILAETAAAIRAKEVEDLNRELKEMRALVEELHSALRAEQAEKSNLQAKVVALEREVEGMDFVRRRWLREDASNRSRGSNLERRLAGNTGNLRTFLFGAEAKPTTAKFTTPEASLSATTGSIRPPAARSVSGRMHGGCGGGAATSERSSAAEEEDGDMALSTTTAEGNAVRRARETAELERSELRRRHEVEMSAKQSRIEKLKLEIRRLEAERDGLKQAAESQAGLFKDGYAELKACLDQMKACRPPPPLPSYATTTPSAEAGRRLSQETPPPKAHHRSRRSRSDLAVESDEIDVSPPADDSRAGAARGRRVDISNGWGCRGPTSEADRGSSRHFAARRGDSPRGAGDDGGSSTASDGSGTLWVRVVPTDENSSEEDLKSPRSPARAATPWRGREELLRRYLGGGDGAESETPPSGSKNRATMRAAEAQPRRSTQPERPGTFGAARGTGAAGDASGSSRSPSPDGGGDNDRALDDLGPKGRVRADPGSKRRGMKREHELKRMPETELAAAGNSTTGSGVIDRSGAAVPRPWLLERTEGGGELERSRAKGPSCEEGRARAESGGAWGERGLPIAAARKSS